MSVLTFTGDVTETRKQSGLARETWIITLTDLSTSMKAIVVCAGDELVWVAKNVKIGQVMEVTGPISRSQIGAVYLTPILLRAKSGVNEKEINEHTHAWSKAIFQGAVEGLSTDKFNELENRRVEATLEARKHEVAATLARTEAAELREKLEETDRALQYERLLNGAVKE